MVVNMRVIIYILLLIIFASPNFYYNSHFLARLTDLFTMLLMFSYIIFNIKFLKSSKEILKYIFCATLFLLSIFTSLLLASTAQDIILQDFFDLYRPMVIIISLLFGVAIANRGINYYNIGSFIICLGVIASIVAFLEKIGFDIFYYLYSNENFAKDNRVSSIYYDFAEFGVMQLLATSFSLERYLKTKNKRYILYIFIFIISVILSTSKAAILLFILFFCLYFLFNAKKIILKLKNTLYFLILIVIFTLFIFIYFNYGDKTVITGFNAIFNFNIGHPSVGNRIEQINIVVSSIINNFNLNTLFGYSSFRGSESSYIEVTFFLFLFRFGIIGIMFYYGLFLFIVFSKNKKLFFIKLVIISSLLLDCVSQITDRFSFPIIIFIMVGILSAENLKIKHIK